MRRAIQLSICLSSFCGIAACGGNEFFAFDNGVGRGEWTPEHQARTLVEIGFHGIGYSGTEYLEARLAAFEEHGVTIFNLYVPCYVDRAPAYGADLVQAIERLEGTGIDLWLTVQGSAEDDVNAVQAVREIADLAVDSGIRVALYPHFGFFVADITDAMRIASQVDRENVGVTFNLCHELRAGNEPRFDELLDEAAPNLYYVSINGADHEGGWVRLIRPLGDGEFDVYAVLRKLQSVGYEGPIGLQCYGVKGDQVANLKKSMAQWIEYQERLIKDNRAARLRLDSDDPELQQFKLEKEERERARKALIQSESWEETVENLIYTDGIDTSIMSDASDVYRLLKKVKELDRVQKLLADDVENDPALKRRIIAAIEKSSERYLTEMPLFDPSARHPVGETVISCGGMPAAAYVLAKLDDDASRLGLAVRLHEHHQTAAYESAKARGRIGPGNEYVYSADGWLFAESAFTILDRMLRQGRDLNLDAEERQALSDYRALRTSPPSTYQDVSRHFTYQSRILGFAKKCVADSK